MSTTLIDALISSDQTAALRVTEQLEPTAGPRQPIQPPTFPRGSGERGTPDKNYVRYDVPVTDAQGRPVFHDGQRVSTLNVLVDTVQSQANRAETGLQRLIDDGELDLPVLEFTIYGSEDAQAVREETIRNLRATRRLTNLLAPHRHLDPIIRFSTIDLDDYARLDPAFIPAAEDAQYIVGGRFPFARTPIGQQIVASSPTDLRPLLRYAPLSLGYGFWASFGNAISADRTRLARRYSSTITAVDAAITRSGAVKSALFNESRSVQLVPVPGDELQFGIREGSKSGKPFKPANLGIGANPVEVHEQGVIAERLDWVSTISVRGLAQIPLGGLEKQARHDVAAALSILLLIGRLESDLFLRSGTDLVRQPGTERRIEMITTEGQVSDLDSVSTAELIEAFEEARKRVNRHEGLRLGTSQDSIPLHLSEGYRKLIDASNEPASIFKGDEGA